MLLKFIGRSKSATAFDESHLPGLCKTLLTFCLLSGLRHINLMAALEDNNQVLCTFLKKPSTFRSMKKKKTIL